MFLLAYRRSGLRRSVQVAAVERVPARPVAEVVEQVSSSRRSRSL
jgi:hypothetical protein